VELTHGHAMRLRTGANLAQDRCVTWAVKTGIVIALGLLVGVIAADAFAQDVTSLEGLLQMVQKGDRITVGDVSGREMTGRLSVLSPTSLTLLVDDRPRTWQEADIAAVYRRHVDSVANGAGIGVLAGLVTGLAVVASSAPDSDSDDVWPISPAVVVGIAAGAGAAIGAGVDAAIVGRRAIFRKPQTSRVSVALIGLSGARAVAVVQVGF
jgi:hypothetical protein